MRASYRWIEMKAIARDSNHSAYENNSTDNEYYINRVYCTYARERNYRFGYTTNYKPSAIVIDSRTNSPETKKKGIFH